MLYGPYNVDREYRLLAQRMSLKKDVRARRADCHRTYSRRPNGRQKKAESAVQTRGHTEAWPSQELAGKRTGYHAQLDFAWRGLLMGLGAALHGHSLEAALTTATMAASHGRAISMERMCV